MARAQNSTVEDLYEIFEFIFKFLPPWTSLPIAATGFGVIVWWFHQVPFFSGFGYIIGVAFVIIVLLAGFRGHVDRKRQEEFQQQNLDIQWAKSLTWQQFEETVGAIFQKRGYLVERTGGKGEDGGVDLRLRNVDEIVLVQCKRWKTWAVGVGPIRELFGVVAAEDADRGILVTTSTYTKRACDFAAKSSIELIDGIQFTRMARELQGKESPQEPSTAQSRCDQQSSPRCPRCSGDMALKKARKGTRAGKMFGGCLRFPSCTGSRDA